ncbi:MAG: BACON domain-containing protein [Alistipes sp.]|nr:BACON domain-containing protein [Candidatus Alistipes equi]
MKRILSILTLFASFCFLFSCEDEHKLIDGIFTSTDFVIIRSQEGGHAEVSIACNYPVEISSSAEWCTFEVIDSKLLVIEADLMTEKERNAIIRITTIGRESGEIWKDIFVTQVKESPYPDPEN